MSTLTLWDQYLLHLSKEPTVQWRANQKAVYPLNALSFLPSALLYYRIQQWHMGGRIHRSHQWNKHMTHLCVRSEDSAWSHSSSREQSEDSPPAREQYKEFYCSPSGSDLKNKSPTGYICKLTFTYKILKTDKSVDPCEEKKKKVNWRLERIWLRKCMVIKILFFFFKLYHLLATWPKGLKVTFHHKLSPHISKKL